LNIQNCGFKRNTNILNEKGFSIAIRYTSGDINVGWIKVVVVE